MPDLIDYIMDENYLNMIIPRFLKEVGIFILGFKNYTTFV